MQNGLTLDPQIVVEHQERHLGGEGPPEKGGAPAPHWACQPSGPVLSQHLAVKIRKDCLPVLVRHKVAGNPDALLYSLHTDSLACKHSPSLWWRGAA